MKTKTKLLILFNHIAFALGLYLYTDMWWLSILGTAIIGKIGGEIGLHKMISHKNINPHPVVRQIIYFLGALNGFGSHISWAGVHRKHHDKSDTTKDPHGCQPRWRVWSTFWYPFNIEVKYVKDLLKDKTLRFYHTHYFSIIITLYILFASISLPLFLLFVCGGAALSFHQAGIVNAFGHKNNQPVNSLMVNIFSFGSGYHKNHHDDSSLVINGKYDIFGRLGKICDRA